MFFSICFLRYKIVIIESININFVTFATFFINLFTFLFSITFVLTKIYITYTLHSILSNLTRLSLI